MTEDQARMDGKADERVITPGMGPFERFQKGDHVAHLTVGDGTVTSNDGKAIGVSYDRLDKFGRPLTGLYDQLWFELHPDWLFHRNTEPTP